MLSTQVEYWKLQETIRHQKEVERQGEISLRLTEAQIAEQARANRVKESQGWESLAIEGSKAAETGRANRVKEEQNWFGLGIQEAAQRESERSNRANESIKWSTLAETVRHDVAEEALKRGDQWINQQNADTREAELELKRDEVKNALLLGFLNAGFSQEQAAAQTTNAQANTQNAETKTKEYKLNRGKTISTESRNWLTTAWNIGVEAYKMTK